ncbi:MAG TPA: hypothetical protein DCP57_11430 [Gammaproteobacteria bacterium]|nr:MAG: LysR family transcriptional regulator [OM182 bacterium]HAL43048.1 hypothetical protein [Gammaproteobacteria bacterium]HBK16993.1 hypothetical protein [Gammaproteobacteria bacterium]|tara:strand:+ start:12560 stop:13486 length:927 start_codon:yes stop_codon:yes gene_type:complete
MDWDDYKFFSALATTKSVRGASSLLEVNPSTVSRRLELFEQRLGVPLFVRSPKGLLITPEGAEVISRVNRVAEEIGNIEGRLKGRDQKLSGPIQVVIPEVLGMDIILPELERFRALYKDVQLHIHPTHAKLDVTRREADVAIVATANPVETLVGRKLSDLTLAAYGAVSLLEQAEQAESRVVEALPWLEYLSHSEMGQACRSFRRSEVPDAQIAMSTHSLLLHAEAARKGLGLAFLPTVIAESDPKLRRIESVRARYGPPLWMLIHPDLRSTHRVSVFIDFVRKVFSRKGPELIVDGAAVAAGRQESP